MYRSVFILLLLLLYTLVFNFHSVLTFASIIILIIFTLAYSHIPHCYIFYIFRWICTVYCFLFYMNFSFFISLRIPDFSLSLLYLISFLIPHPLPTMFYITYFFFFVFSIIFLLSSCHLYHRYESTTPKAEMSVTKIYESIFQIMSTNIYEQATSSVIQCFLLFFILILFLSVYKKKNWIWIISGLYK